jgi:molybdopterin synthase sulfur carrier subunit
MKITLRTFATFREILGARETALDLPPGENIRGLLERLCQNHAGLRERLFDAAGAFKAYNLVLKNGRGIASLSGLDTVIDEGDVIALFPPVAGG